MGPLASELRLETAALLLLAAFSVVAALLPRNAALSLADWVVPVAALVFSAGLAYSGFSAAQAVGGLLSLLPQLGQASGPFAWFAHSVTAVLALLMVGALLLGVGGLIASAALAVLLAAMAHAALQRFPPQ
jgi:ABC-type sugar transport system permease subunit